MAIHNLTPHPINVLDSDNNIIKIIPSNGIARVKTESKICDILIKKEDKPVIIKQTKFLDLDIDLSILHNVDWGDIIIVSRIVATAIANTHNEYSGYIWVVPDDIVRDNEGNIIGCRSFSV